MSTCYVSWCSYKAGVPAPISAATNGQYIRARQMGLADADFAAVRAAYDAECLKESVECE